MNSTNSINPISEFDLQSNSVQSKSLPAMLRNLSTTCPPLPRIPAFGPYAVPGDGRRVALATPGIARPCPLVPCNGRRAQARRAGVRQAGAFRNPKSYGLIGLGWIGRRRSRRAEIFGLADSINPTNVINPENPMNSTDSTNSTNPSNANGREVEEVKA